MTRAPAWPVWTVPLALIGIVSLGGLAVLAAAVLAALAGADEITPPLVVLAAVLSTTATWLVLRQVSRRAGIALAPADLGLRRVAPRMAIVVLAFGLAVALVAGGLTGLLADPLEDAQRPAELDAPVDLGPALLLSVLGRAVIGAIAVEAVLRGFVLPALIGWRGRTLAIVLVAVLSSVTGSAPLAPAAAAIGVALCVMYLESGSILPGIALNAAVLAYVEGRVCDWTIVEAAGLGLAAGAAAFAVAWAGARSWDPGPARG
jgi:membrane protease YdiL (CAAX protease family)